LSHFSSREFDFDVPKRHEEDANASKSCSIVSKEEKRCPVLGILVGRAWQVDPKGFLQEI
jgi:hypothetical protein